VRTRVSEESQREDERDVDSIHGLVANSGNHSHCKRRANAPKRDSTRFSHRGNTGVPQAEQEESRLRNTVPHQRKAERNTLSSPSET
jgi:hypothetical protein